MIKMYVGKGVEFNACFPLISSFLLSDNFKQVKILLVRIL